MDIESSWVNVALTLICVVCAGLAAGLTMGLVSIEPLEMAIKQRSGESENGLIFFLLQVVMSALHSVISALHSVMYTSHSVMSARYSVIYARHSVMYTSHSVIYARHSVI